IAEADVNGDGLRDLVTANKSTNDVSVLLGVSDGRFQAPQHFMVGRAPAAVAIADLNGDGRDDLIIANEGSNTVSVLIGNGDGTFHKQQQFVVGINPSSVAAADFNRDGILDLVVANQGDIGSSTPADVSVLLGKGDSAFQPEQRFAAGDRPLSVAVGDLNADG